MDMNGDIGLGQCQHGNMGFELILFIMLWRCFNASGTSALHKEDGIIINLRIFQHHLKPLARRLKSGHNWDLSNLIMEWITQANIRFNQILA